MAKVDLHVHSRYSEHPSEWFLQRLGAGESYTEPEFVYRQAVSQGMTFVTLTDHNSFEGVAQLARRYPGTVITGMEATTYFPEDGCKVHCLIYGLTQEQFVEIQRLRSNIYTLREYLVREDLAHSVAHATYSVNGKLTLEHLERLILLFNVFEGINGGRSRLNNDPWIRALQSLSPWVIDELAGRHGIDPLGPAPWIKGFTAGTDDHAGLFIGRTYTESPALTPEQFLDDIRQRRTTAHGSHNTFQGLAFSIYKIACEFTRERLRPVAKSFPGLITDQIFYGNPKPLGFMDRLRLRRFKRKAQGDRIKWLAACLIETFNREAPENPHDRLNAVYDRICDLCDELLRTLVGSVQKDLAAGRIARLMQNVSASLVGMFISAPFFSTIHHMNQCRTLNAQLSVRFPAGAADRPRKLLAFVDVLDFSCLDTARKLCQAREGVEWKIVSCLPAGLKMEEPWLISLQSACPISVPARKTARILIPSILRAVRQLHEFDADQILILSSGPVGLLGMFFSRLLSLESTAVLHGQFHRLVNSLFDEDSAGFLESYVQWFQGLPGQVQPSAVSGPRPVPAARASVRPGGPVQSNPVPACC